MVPALDYTGLTFSARCMREFNTDVVKSFTAMVPIEDKCHLSLRDSPTLLFGMPSKPNANTIVFLQIL